MVVDRILPLYNTDSRNKIKKEKHLQPDGNALNFLFLYVDSNLREVAALGSGAARARVTLCITNLLVVSLPTNW